MSATSSTQTSGERSEAVHQLVEGVGERGLHVLGQMRVDLRRAQASVAENVLNDPQTHSGFQ